MKVISKLDLSQITASGSIGTFDSDKAINMHVSLPCPLKVPFRQLFTPFVETYNALHPDMPIVCSSITDCSLGNIEDDFRTAKVESTLPDIILTTNFRILLAGGFYDRFIANHIYQGVVNPKYADQVSSPVKECLLENNIGVWMLSSWSFVQDLTVEQPSEAIESWKQLISPEMAGKITAHGHVDKATFSIAYFLKEKYGEEALKQYAQNIGDIKHFAQAIKRINSTDSNKTLLTMLPDVAISNIPSNKKIKILDLKDAKVLSPMVMMVKKSKLEACREILEVLWSDTFETLLSETGGILPYKLSPETNYFLPDFKDIAGSFEEKEAEVDKIYTENLRWDVIEPKMTEGGICK